MLPDGKTVIGPDGSDYKKLMMENIILKNQSQIGTHGGFISTVLYDSLTQSLLVGDDSGHVKQYRKVNESFTMIRDYGDVDLGDVVSSTKVGRFGIFGGQNYSLVAIDISGQRVYAGLPKSPFKYTYSLQVCKGEGSRVLSLGGNDPQYSSDESDCLDVTLLYNSHNKDSPRAREYMNQAHVALREKDKLIESLNLKIKKLESSLQKQKKKKTGMTNL